MARSLTADDPGIGGVHPTPATDAAVVGLLERSRRVLDQMHPEDREEAIELHDRLETAIEAGDGQALREASEVLKELLSFVEGQV